MINFLIWFGIMAGLLTLVILIVMLVAWIKSGCDGEPDGDDIGMAAIIVLMVLTTITGTIITFKYVADPVPKQEISQEEPND